MTTCGRYHGWMMEALYNEMDDARRVEFDAHVRNCADCTALFSEMQGTADLMSRRRRPDPGPEFWDGFWRRLEQRVAREDSVVVDASRFARRRSLGSWGYRVAAVVAVLAAGVWIGRTVLAPPPASDQPQVAMETARGDSIVRAPLDTGRDGVEPRAETNDEVIVQRERTPAAIDAVPGEGNDATMPEQPAQGDVVLASSDHEAQRYIERSQMLLLAVLNSDPADSSGFDAQKQRAGELVRVASSVREASQDRRVQELVAQLAMILREIAHLEQSSDVDAVELIRSRVDREGVLLRINMEQMRSESARGAID